MPTHLLRAHPLFAQGAFAWMGADHLGGLFCASVYSSTAADSPDLWITEGEDDSDKFSPASTSAVPMARVAAIDAQLLGRRLYETMLVWDTEEFSDPTMAEFAEIWRPLEKVVFSTTLTSVEGSNRLATGTLEEEIAALGDRRIAVGGAGLAAECMRRGLIDEFELFVVPIVVGGGTPYFPPDVHVDLELVETRTFGATVYLRYRRRG